MTTYTSRMYETTSPDEQPGYVIGTRRNRPIHIRPSTRLKPGQKVWAVETIRNGQPTPYPTLFRQYKHAAMWHEATR